MNREKISSFIGLLLLLICFAIALIRVFSRHQEASPDNGVTVIRFAHWQLESGLRDAMEVLAKDYEKLHPGVRIEQLAIPERTYSQWLRTQLIGGTACDIIELGFGMDDEMAARFFLPISQIVEQPNPYNAGTDFEDTAWRETFTDGMVGGWNFRPTLLEYYGVPLSMFTIRVYYNETLWERVLGDTPVPKDYDAFLEVCEKVRAYAKSSGRQIIPIAGSKANGPMLIDKLFTSQTQKLNQDIAPLANLKPTSTDIAISLLNKEWTIDDPAYTDALTISRQVGLSMQPGYSSLGREDATFYFVQGRALMITTGSWDSPSFRAQAPFNIQVFDIPIPSLDHPRYGKNELGPASEAEVSTGLSFGVTRQSTHQDIAIDFLHYITSKTGNTTFSQVSGWLPAVAGVTPPPEVIPFIPNTDGYPNGFTSTLNSIGANSARVISSANNRLVGPTGSVKEFQDSIREALPQAIGEDLKRNIKVSLINIARQDVLGAALIMINAEDNTEAERNTLKSSQIREGQNSQEMDRSWIEHELTRLNP